ncbi:MAG: hypothetical protein WA063_00960, partial [Minisyncoccia bacterium]
IIRSITSTVDALGVTAETKCPAFFRSPEVIKILQKVKLFADTHEGKVSPDAMEMYKDQLRKIADKEPDAGRKEGYYSAIENQFNPVTAEMTLGQYTGVLKDIKMAEEEGRMLPHISMEVSRAQALLGDLFGDKMSVKAFVKAMEDFGVSKESMADIAKTLKQIKEAGTDEEKRALKEKLKYSSDKAVFEFASEFADGAPEIKETFDELARFAIRDEIRKLSRNLESPENRTAENIGSIFNEFSTSLGERIDEQDLGQIMIIQKEITDSADRSGDFDKALVKFNTFITKKEKEFMNI